VLRPIRVLERSALIQLTRINHVPLVLNADLIEHIETTPDTVVSLTNGQKFVVLESTSEIIHKVLEFRRAIQKLEAKES
jgi:flagellar protein FlbD